MLLDVCLEKSYCKYISTALHGVMRFGMSNDVFSKLRHSCNPFWQSFGEDRLFPKSSVYTKRRGIM